MYNLRWHLWKGHLTPKHLPHRVWEPLPRTYLLFFLYMGVSNAQRKAWWHMKAHYWLSNAWPCAILHKNVKQPSLLVAEPKKQRHTNQREHLDKKNEMKCQRRHLVIRTCCNWIAKHKGKIWKHTTDSTYREQFSQQMDSVIGIFVSSFPLRVLDES